MISVCIATYNGEKYIKKQLESILPQLSDKDEIIISDDNSTDNTIQIIKNIHDERIKIFNNPASAGYAQNFANALNHSKGDYIFLSDQDDTWVETKIETMMPYFKEGYNLITHNAHVINEHGEMEDKSWWEYAGLDLNQNLLQNLYLNAYSGCMMAFDRALLNNLLPIPQSIEQHDQWLYIVAKLHKKKIKILDENLMNYRRHTETQTGHKRPLSIILKTRLQTVANTIKYSFTKGD